MTDPPQRFLFVHMQKTAGISLRYRLMNHFGRAAVYPTQGVDGTDPVALVVSVDYLRERLAARGDEIRVITGHFPLCTADLIEGRYITLTLLREPVERTLSYLRHHRENEPADRDKSMEEIYSDPFRFRGFVQNHMTKMLALRPDEMNDGMLTEVDFTPAYLDRAKEGLESVDAFGLQEEFEEFCGRLETGFELHLGEPEVRNTSDPVEVPQDFRDRIAEDNALDIELYEFARQLLADDLVGSARS